MRRQLRSLTLHQLDIFSAVVREGSFNRAAESLTLSPAAVSQQIALLERAVKVRLLDRQPRRRLSLTEAGRMLLGVCDAVFQHLDQGLEELDKLGGNNEALVSFGATRAFCSYLLPAIYASFREGQPGVAVRFETGGQNKLLDDVHRRRLDLALLFDPAYDPDLEAIPLATDDRVLIGLPEHPLAQDGPSPFDAVTRERLILTAGNPGRIALDRLAAAHGLQLHVSWEVRTLEAEITAVTRGMGIGLVPYYVVTPHLADRTMSLLQVEDFPIRMTWYLVSLADRLSEPARVFRDHLLDHRQEIEALSLCPSYRYLGVNLD